MTFLQPAPGIKPPSSTSWQQIVEEAAKKQPDVYGVKGKTGVTNGIARYAAKKLNEAKAELQKAQVDVHHVTIWFEPDVEVHENVPDGNGGFTTIRTDNKTGTFSTYIEVKPTGRTS
jgi:hypothetical protein